MNSSAHPHFIKRTGDTVDEKKMKSMKTHKKTKIKGDRWNPKDGGMKRLNK